MSLPLIEDPDEPAALLYDHLMELHRQLFATERYEAAYHVLAAALHVAQEVEDIERLGNIERLARSRQADVDAALPVHPMASVSARRRGNPAMYQTLALTAKSAGGRVRADRARRGRRAAGSL